jgi:serine/threonine-protein kinase
LTRCVGPIASVLVDEILAQYPYITAQGFIETLTSQISNIEQAKEFKSRLKIPVELIADGQLLATPASAAETVLPQSLQTGDHTSNQGNTKTSKLDDAFMDSCVRELTRCVGPIANVIIKKVLTHNPQISRRTLIEALAVQIPDPQRAIEFRQQLKRFE